MLLLLLVILLNTAVAVLFKFYGKHQVSTTTAIVVNYWASAGTGSLLLGRFPVTAETLHAPWLYVTVLLGAAFFVGYQLFSYAIHHYGVTTATVSSRMALVLAVIFAWVAFSDEQFNWVGLAGVILAFPAVYLTAAKSQNSDSRNQRSKSKNQKPKFKAAVREIEVEGPEKQQHTEENSGNEASKKGFHMGWGVLALFLIGGAQDIGRSVLSHNYVETDKELQAVTTVHIFMAAALVGTVVLIYRLVTGKSKFSLKSVLAGLLLAGPDFFANYLFVRVLASDDLLPSVAVPVNNIGIVIVSVLAAYFLFKEQFGLKRVFGIVLSLLAIFLISFKELFS